MTSVGVLPNFFEGNNLIPLESPETAIPIGPPIPLEEIIRY